MSKLFLERSTSLIGENFYIIFIVLAMFSMYFGVRNGVISSILIVFMSIEVLSKSSSFIGTKVSKLTLWIMLYVGYSILTILISLLRGFPIYIILSEVANSILPIMFFFYAKKISSSEEDKFEKKVIIASFVLIVSGIYYNTTLNDTFYIAYLNRAYPNFSIFWFERYPRLTSWVGSVNLGVVLNVALGFAFIKFIKAKNYALSISLIIILSLGIVLTMQRSAIFVSFIYLVFIIGYILKNKHLTRHNLLIAFSAIFVFGVLSFIFFPEIIIYNFSRIINLQSAFTERISDWLFAFDNGCMIILGMGFGTGGQRAIGIFDKTINDGNYFKMIFEIGLVGFSFFLMTVYLTFLHALRKLSKTSIYLLIVIGFLIQAIGSNILTFQFSASLFWYCIGIIDKKYTSKTFNE